MTNQLRFPMMNGTQDGSIVAAPTISFFSFTLLKLGLLSLLYDVMNNRNYYKALNSANIGKVSSQEKNKNIVIYSSSVLTC